MRRAAALVSLIACAKGPNAPTRAADPPLEQQCAHARMGWDCWLPVPSGTFRMGAQSSDAAAPGYDPAATPDEGPVHPATVAERWMLKSELSASTWATCVGAGRCRAEDRLNDPRDKDPHRSGLPATGLTFRGAVDACAFLGGRLPTEAEWEHAARADELRRFPWGDDERCPAADPLDPAGDKTPTVGFCLRQGPTDPGALRHPSPFGLLGMAGNVWEWVDTAWGPYGGAPDPRGLKIQRGGAFTAESAADVRSAARAAMPPDQAVHDVGARCVWGPP
jgi:formylglycine-generating enzyme required for sulfatase activity